MTEVAAFQATASPASSPTPAPVAPAAPSHQDDPNGAQVIKRESDGGVYPAGTPIPDPEKPDSAPTGSTGTDVATANAKPDPDDDETSAVPPLNGVPIVGVVSLSKKKSIREFNKKDHYNQWLFIFNPYTNPTSGALGLISTPDQPSLQTKAQASGLKDENPTQDAGANLGQPNGVLTPSAGSAVSKP